MVPGRALITGGAGFIGSNLAHSFASKGCDVTVVDNLWRPGSGANLAWLRERHRVGVRFVEADCRDYQQILKAAKGQQLICHCAGQTAVTSSLLDPRADFEHNLVGTFNLLEAARQAGDDPIFVFTSTNKVYGRMEDLPVVERDGRYEYDRLPEGVSERQPLDFHSPYGCSKGGADLYVRDYSRSYGLRSVVFRQSCIYGPRQMGVEEQGWVAWFVIAAVTGRPITIYGDGKQVRDLLYIDDLVRAVELAVEHIDRTRGEVYNIGGGPRNTLAVWAEFGPMLTRLLGRAVEPAAYAEWRPGDQRVFVCDIRKAERDFGWQPTVPVESGIGRVVDWVTGHRELFEG